jgi:hypothetical protein
MGILGFLVRVRSAIRSGAADPTAFYGADFRGMYEPRADSILGGVAREGNLYPPTQVIALRDGAVVASTDQLQVHGNSWRFALQLGFVVTADDILRERIAVFAVDRRGARSALRIDGTVQLSYVRENFSSGQLELEIDFSASGNASDYLRKGWSTQEPDHIWTDGRQSTIAVDFARPGDRYRLELLAWPFTEPASLPDQALTITVSEVTLGHFSLGPRQHLIECDIPGELTAPGNITITLGLPRAARPSELGINKDPRMLALACKRLRLTHRPQMHDPDEADPLRAASPTRN